MYKLLSVVICMLIVCSGCSWISDFKLKKWGEPSSKDTILHEETINEETEPAVITDALSEIEPQDNKDFSKNIYEPSKDATPFITPVASVDTTSKLQQEMKQQSFPQVASIGREEHNKNKEQPTVSHEQTKYKESLQMYEKRNYNDAIKLFDIFIKDYPQSRLLPNALYWKAESLYAQQKYAEAIFIFKSVTEKYPKHPKASDALLKTAMSYKQLGDQENAMLHYRALYEDYPNSSAASYAKKLNIIPIQ